MQIIRFLMKCRCLLRALETVECNVIRTMRDEIVSGIEKYFGGADDRDHFRSIEENSFYTIATLLDPRFKKKLGLY